MILIGRKKLKMSVVCFYVEKCGQLFSSTDQRKFYLSPSTFVGNRGFYTKRILATQLSTLILTVTRSMWTMKLESSPFRDRWMRLMQCFLCFTQYHVN